MLSEMLRATCSWVNKRKPRGKSLASERSCSTGFKVTSLTCLYYWTQVALIQDYNKYPDRPVLQLAQDVVSFSGMKEWLIGSPLGLLWCCLCHVNRSELLNRIWNKQQMIALQILSYKSRYNGSEKRGGMSS